MIRHPGTDKKSHGRGTGVQCTEEERNPAWGREVQKTTFMAVVR